MGALRGKRERKFRVEAARKAADLDRCRHFLREFWQILQRNGVTGDE